jgi:hypothetical protein
MRLGLRYIVQICNELGLKQEVEEYVTKLRRAEENAKGKGIFPFEFFLTV